MNYAKLAFTDAVKKLQEQNGSRKNYERMERFTSKEGLTPNEISMIETRDWNCPQHITPRYTLEEIEETFNNQN